MGTVRTLYRGLIIGAVTLQFGCSGSSPDADPDENPVAGTAPTAGNGAQEGFVAFESGQVRPLALAGDGSRLLATNTPNATLDILAITDTGLQPMHSVPVGLEPVAVALFGDDQAWVVNHLSDSISIVDLAAEPPRVIDTLLVGDEPRDIVFAGEDRSLAFVTTAHRGQNGPDDAPIDAQLLTPGVGRADVWVFDATARGETLGGDPVSVLSMFGDTPGALAVSPDGLTVHAAVMHSGNRTTAVGEGDIAKAGPVQNAAGVQQPDTGLIVKFDDGEWRDELDATADLDGTAYGSLVRFELPDNDVFSISATRTPSVVDRHSGVGTTLFAMVSNPIDGTVYVSNTEANNLTRFEGEGAGLATANATVRGNIVQSRVTLIESGDVDGSEKAAVQPRNLNRQLDHTQPQASEQQRALAMSQPVGMAISDDGSTLYVAGLGSRKVAVYDTAELAADSFTVSAAGQIALDAGGPTGLALDEARGRLYALTRFDNGIAVIDLSTRQQTDSVALYNPEPQHVVQGRPFLYDATAHSSHGDASCASCHVFGDVDAMAWDLGNPDEPVRSNPNRFVNLVLSPSGQASFHPMKGPMTTQSLRGLSNSGPMHWRGDRTGSSALEGQSLEHAAFSEFNAAFPELLGRDAPLSEADMKAFADFALELTYPPNPIRALDNSLSRSQQEGERIYRRENTTGEEFTCNDCHRIDPADGFFGTAGNSSVEGDDISQEFKVPHVRNLYQKVGKFGNSGRFAGSDVEFGEQIRGFGFMHDGNMDTLDNFLQGEVFSFDPDAQTAARKRRQVIDFVMAADSDLAPIVGQQVTLHAASGPDTQARLDLLLERAAVTTPRAECDLIAHGVIAGEPRAFLLSDSGTFQDDAASAPRSVDEMKALAGARGAALTFTCVPPGSGARMSVGSTASLAHARTPATTSGDRQ